MAVGEGKDVDRSENQQVRLLAQLSLYYDRQTVQYPHQCRDYTDVPVDLPSIPPPLEAMSHLQPGPGNQLFFWLTAIALEI